MTEAVSTWLSFNSGFGTPVAQCSQGAWDDIGAKRVVDRITEEATGSDLARLKAVTRPESGAWLHALPSPHLRQWEQCAMKLIYELGHRLRDNGHDTRSGSFLVQRLALAIQRGNAASVIGTFAPGMLRGGLFE